jgi:UDP-glucuronate 4-epimerase
VALEALVSKKPSGAYRLYNLGGSEAVPLTKFVSLIEKQLGKKAKIRYAPLQAGDVPATIADCTRAARDLAYAPRMSVADGIREFVAWYQEEKSFLSKLSEPKQ